MNDLELYIYIALAAIYFLSRAFRKKKASRPPVRPQGTGTGQSKNPDDYRDRPITFEDLLREFTGQKEIPGNQRRVEEPREPETIVSEEERYLDSEEEMVESYSIPTDNTYMSYDEVFSPDKSLITLDEQVNLKTTTRKSFERYREEEEDNIHIAQRYRELLSDADGVRDAIILKEILDRKYF